MILGEGGWEWGRRVRQILRQIQAYYKSVSFHRVFHNLFQETLRPDFVDKIQHYIRDGPKSTMPKRMKRYTEVDRATGETVYILPVWYSLPKLLASFSVLCVMVSGNLNFL